MGDEFPLRHIDRDLRVCSSCFYDDGLKAFVDGLADSNECSFCGTVSDQDIAAPLDEVVEHIRTSLERYFDNPDNAGMSYESREGGYQGQVWDTYDIVEDEVPVDEIGGDLFQAICEGLGDQLWCDRYLYCLGPDDALAYSWKKFCETVKHESRYFFTQRGRSDDDSEILSPSELLETIVEYAKSSGLIRTIDAGEALFRARFQAAGENFSLPSELGPPPPSRASQNRMSPAGIVMMYVSEDANTAVREAACATGNYSVGTFRILRDVAILDLASLPNVPTIFAEVSDTAEVDPRTPLIFLHSLAEDISRPIVRDDRIHIDYVPTQVVTEFVRGTMRDEGGSRIDGIRYRSSRSDDGISLVLFADADNVVGACDHRFPKSQLDEWLELVIRIELTFDMEDLVEHPAIERHPFSD
ncbi:MAG: HEPN-associated N-terminal domain-containing protein [Rhizomicrobium sp.]